MKNLTLLKLTSLITAFVLALLPATTTAQSPAQGEDVHILFIHHSCGGQLLADNGDQSFAAPSLSSACIYVSHPNGGGLRSGLEATGYVINESSYGSQVGEDTDIHHWHAKFRDQMDRILKTKQQDELLPDGQTNRVVVFKSCYPNNEFVGEGDEPGDPDSPKLTVANAKAAYNSLLPLFAKHPEVLFVAMTAPPRAEPSNQSFKAKIKRMLKGAPKDAMYARQFNNWLATTESGWLADYTTGNVAVFDHYNILTNEGASDWAAYPTGDGLDSHPNASGNAKSAAAFQSFLTETLKVAATP